MSEATEKRVPLWLLAMITFSGTVGMYIFVPGLPQAAVDLGATTGAMQLTISLYILGLALGQPIYGPLADRFGRRPVLIGGLCLYILAGLVAVLAPNAETLVVARLFQALGGCAGLVLGRAIVRDTSGTKEAAQRLALLNLLVTAGPGLAPLVGSGVTAAGGWRLVLVLLCLLGVANLLFTWRMLPETGQPKGGPVSTLVRDYLRLAGSPVFLGYAICGGCVTTASYAFFGSAPFIFRELDRPPHETGIYLAILVIGISIGNWMASRLIARAKLDQVVAWASLMGVVAVFLLLGVVLAGQLTVAWAMGCMFVFTLGVGTAGPAALAQAISLNPRLTGSASGLYGFMQMVVGSICTALAGLGSDPALSAAMVLAGAGVVGQIAFYTALRGKRHIPAAE
ncbi:multidrug effflux MFS transporter [Roseomonas xinghualingensis]|uniref:multidrug effflux MFS transporter n=1 Tax=Roseomonas xinghualingensis TaxID=2986475 RepID=UPI0021F1042A|nr:multidrug effflux MFS transporter [Roseomonas sp. SXEYE001]MCV4206061.1 multidrug effflux MFS transporter [Roseomonas sp. SXEYE001]